MLYGFGVRCIDFLRIMSPAAQVPNLLVRHLRDHFKRLWATAKEMLANEGTIIGLEGLIVAVQGIHHDLMQGTVFVIC